MDNKKKIVEGAAVQFMQYGVRSVTMDDVARDLGMSKKTLYQSFANKDELVEAVSKAHIAQEKIEFGEAEENASNAIEELFNITKCLRRSMWGINSSLLFDLQKYHPSS